MFWVVLICRAAMLRVAWHYNMQMKASSERCSAWRRTETSPDKNIFFCIKSRRNCHLIKSIWLLLLGELCSSFYLHQDEVDLLPRHCRAASRNPNKYKWSSFLFRRQYLTYFFINLQQHLCLLLRLWGFIFFQSLPCHVYLFQFWSIDAQFRQIKGWFSKIHRVITSRDDLTPCPEKKTLRASRFSTLYL